MLDKGTIQRASLGQIAGIGAIYDARTDNFSGVSVFKRSIPPGSIQLIDNRTSDISFTHSDSFTEKFTKLDVRAELQVSVLCGLFSLKGSGRYLTDELKSERSVKSSLVYNITTKQESINIYDEKLKDCFALDAIQSGVGTHVLIGIYWGANSVVSAESKNTEAQKKKEIEGNLQANLKKIDLSVSGSAAVNFKEDDQDANKNFEIRVFGDVLAGDGEELPQTFEDALKLIKKMPSLVQAANEGRGKPLQYVLLPLTLLAEALSFSIAADNLLSKINDDVLIRLVQVFEDITSARQKLNDFCDDVKSHSFCISAAEIETVTTLKQSFDIAEAKFRSGLATLLPLVRGGKANAAELESLVGDLLSSPLSKSNVLRQISDLRHLSERMEFADMIVAMGAIYIGYDSSFDTELMRRPGENILAFYFNDQAKKTELDKWILSRQVFMNEINNAPGSATKFVFFATDCDAHPGLLPSGGTTIQQYKSGTVICEDLVKELAWISNTRIARNTRPFDLIAKKPNNRVEFELACPGRDCKRRPRGDAEAELSSEESLEWSCLSCEEIIEYGFDGYLYCRCGRGEATDYDFKCSQREHGPGFEKMEATYMKHQLDKIRAFKQLNILILGETGVGKSTFINAFVNYLHFESLDLAEKHDLLSLIPGSFTVCNEELEEVLVETGVSTNEVQVSGQSATQSCKVYPFTVGKLSVRLIDTPGIGDTRGIGQDKINFENILSTLSNFEELHGIVILLKPNNARLTVMFRFCIKELLTHLHRDASHNIVFGFTNSRGTFYRPGDTLPALRKLLKENQEVDIAVSKHTIYCFDSESYRFLAASKFGIKFDEGELHNFAQSWKHSVDETMRMLKHIRERKPHPIKDTLSLNSVRELIVKLTAPLGEISRNIQTNIKVVHDKMEEIKNSEKSAEELQKDLMIPKIDLEAVPLDHPRTVCTNSACTDTIKVGLVEKTNYIRVCHDKCRVKGVIANTMNCVLLLGCDAINPLTRMCRRSDCGHSFVQHMHVTIDFKQVECQVVDLNVQMEIDKNLTAVQTKAAFIQKTEATIEEYRAEQEAIEGASAKLGHFLKHNAITPFNDAMLEYLDHMIREEKGKVAVGGSVEALVGLEKIRASYAVRFRILETEMNRNEDEGGTSADKVDGVKVMSPTEVDQLVRGLYKLKHFGAELRKAMEVVETSRTHSTKYEEISYTLPKTMVKGVRKFWKKITF